MSLIQCASNCAHQRDGYCTLEQAAHMTGDAAAGETEHCLYYQAKTDEKKAPGAKETP